MAVYHNTQVSQDFPFHSLPWLCEMCSKCQFISLFSCLRRMYINAFSVYWQIFIKLMIFSNFYVMVTFNIKISASISNLKSLLSLYCLLISFVGCYTGMKLFVCGIYIILVTLARYFGLTNADCLSYLDSTQKQIALTGTFKLRHESDSFISCFDGHSCPRNCKVSGFALWHLSMEQPKSCF